jgi:hypothetical protein
MALDVSRGHGPGRRDSGHGVRRGCGRAAEKARRGSGLLDRGGDVGSRRRKGRARGRTRGGRHGWGRARHRGWRRRQPGTRRVGQEVDLEREAVDGLGCGLGNNAWAMRSGTRLREVGHRSRGSYKASDENRTVKTS